MNQDENRETIDTGQENFETLGEQIAENDNITLGNRIVDPTTTTVVGRGRYRTKKRCTYCGAYLLNPNNVGSSLYSHRI